jgi:addiction module RelB/DinJ family antitoxin
MASTILQVRMDENLKKETSEIFHNLGLDMSSAVRLFLNRVVICQGLPFKMTLDQEKEDSLSTEQAKPSFDPVEFLDNYIQNQKMEEKQ